MHLNDFHSTMCNSQSGQYIFSGSHLSFVLHICLPLLPSQNVLWTLFLSLFSQWYASLYLLFSLSLQIKPETLLKQFRCWVLFTYFPFVVYRISEMYCSRIVWYLIENHIPEQYMFQTGAKCHYYAIYITPEKPMQNTCHVRKIKHIYWICADRKGRRKEGIVF